ncbi:MAG: hypothetical protein ACOYKZ_04250 [Chlamydiia bacterium]
MTITGHARQIAAHVRMVGKGALGEVYKIISMAQQNHQGSRWHSGSSVYSPQIVMKFCKYYSNEEMPDTLDASIRSEVALQTELAQADLTPGVYGYVVSQFYIPKDFEQPELVAKKIKLPATWHGHYIFMGDGGPSLERYGIGPAFLNALPPESLPSTFEAKSPQSSTEAPPKPRIKEPIPTTLRFRITLVLRALECLMEVHKLGYVHGDIHPKQFVADQELANVKLIDWGSGCRIETSAHEQRVDPHEHEAGEMVREAWHAPEIRDFEVDGKNVPADVYHIVYTMLLSVISELIAPEEPFVYKEPAKRTEQLQHYFELLRKISPDFAVLMAGYLDPNPESRTFDLEPLIHALHELMTQYDLHWTPEE